VPVPLPPLARGSNTGCTVVGVCGKDPTTAALQDVLVHSVKGVSMYADACRKAGKPTADTDAWVLDTMFSTLTNVNFAADRMQVGLWCWRACIVCA
jgi:hydroxylamine reductase